MSDFLALKQRRAAQATSKTSSSPLPGPTAPSPAASAETEPAVTDAQKDQPEASTSQILQHDDLSTSLEVRQVVDRGRGVFSRARVSAGQTLISTAPLISVLDNKNVQSRCSACFVGEDDLKPGQLLSQCSVCHSLRYCSPKCQRADWAAHRNECKALVAFSKAKGSATGRGLVPDTPIRALGRLLWAMKKDGDTLRRLVDSLQSHRSELSQAQQEQFFQLSVSLASYVGQETLSSTCPSASAVMDLCSRFTSNTFSLTSPHLSNIGVSISPLIALINHSCCPNAVVVFPSFSTSANPEPMRVVAIRKIEPGEEVLTSYVDLALPKRLRQAELRERYYFTCACSLCARTDWEDPREAFVCSKKGCDGLVPMPDIDYPIGDVETSCSSCGRKRTTSIDELKTRLAKAEAELISAEAQQYKDPEGALKTLFSSTAILQSAGHAPTSHPFLATLQTLLAALLYTQSFMQALPTAQLLYSSLRKLSPEGHPTRAIALAAVGKLRIVGTNSGDEERYWRDEAGLQTTISVLVEAMREVEAGFGRGSVLEGELRELIAQTEEGLKMTRMARGM